jgi:hypothetical protein
MAGMRTLVAFMTVAAMSSAGLARADQTRQLKVSGALVSALGGAAAVVGIGLVSAVELKGRPDVVAQPRFCGPDGCAGIGVNHGELYGGAGLIAGGTLLAATGAALIVVATRREHARVSTPAPSACAGSLAVGLRF